MCEVLGFALCRELHSRTWLVAVVLSSLLAACGGGSGGGGYFVNQLQSLAISPVNASVPNGLTQQLTATGTFSDGGMADLTSSVQWTSASPSVATVGVGGLLQAKSLGTATITATLGSVSTTRTVTVTAAALEAIKIAPESSITSALLNSGIGQLRQLAVTGYYSDGTTADVTNQAIWTSSTPAVATIGGSTGLVTGVALGSANITAAIGALTNTVPFNVVTNIWTPTAPMQIPRNDGHTATLLANGSVLIIGGHSTTTGSALAEAEIYHLLTDTWTPTANPPLTLAYHTATLLNDGTVLVTGDCCSQDKVEIYDPVANAWTQGPPMQYAREFHTATLLQNGKVLVAGGATPTMTNSAEIYDPVAKVWSAAAAMPAATEQNRAVLLADGRVLVAGGIVALPPAPAGEVTCPTVAFVYDPAADQWTSTGTIPPTQGCGASVALLANGKVLMAGGGDQNGNPLASTAIYDPTTNTWSAGASLLFARIGASATSLPSGKVLIAAGQAPCAEQQVPCPPPPPGVVATLQTATTELFDPIANTSTMAASLTVARVNHTATQSTDGVILVVGGYVEPPQQIAAAELYW